MVENREISRISLEMKLFFVILTNLQLTNMEENIMEPMWVLFLLSLVCFGILIMDNVMKK